jgi:hypothetical protein
MENHHFQWENPLLMVISNSYVKLPEGRISKKKRTRPGGNSVGIISGTIWEINGNQAILSQMDQIHQEESR